MKLNLSTIMSLVTLLFLQHTITGQETFDPPKLSHPDSWSVILLPDTQTYAKFKRNQGILEVMTGWIRENIAPLNIEMVLCTGDLVEQNELLVPDHINGNEPSRNQWQAVSRAFEKLDGHVPYILAAGNHDFGYKNIENRSSNYDEFFPAHRNVLNHKGLRAAAYNVHGKPTLENATFELTTPNQRKYLFLNLEFAPRDTILQWAMKEVDKDRYKDHRVIVLTHSYLNEKNEHIESENYPIKDGNYGKAIWENLVAPSKNIQMVISGHIGTPDNFKAHTAFKTDINAGGKKVSQITFNAQAMGGGWHGNGGDGWLRILEFLPDGKTVKVITFSPYFAISPATRHMAYKRESYQEFSIQLD
ncbi:Calcineurin-like phosphoesterase [Arenibacter nanhaiticus]|uniref:Calcineurin-like phosphoesterase n=1 Tax=Arenibacter nanhaiticus TaxID=558155 RepID=A0A1M6FRM7_9FLAO|nr:metallophosphoesterase [Arenibacter nanhaiticus]SHJ00324.1 Calcineurin-like phosphoesterase [Arenibacter nanhaiticus]